MADNISKNELCGFKGNCGLSGDSSLLLKIVPTIAMPKTWAQDADILYQYVAKHLGLAASCNARVEVWIVQAMPMPQISCHNALVSCTKSTQNPAFTVKMAHVLCFRTRCSIRSLQQQKS